jgi:hypothetical protein
MKINTVLLALVPFVVSCVNLESNLGSEFGLGIYTNNTCWVDPSEIDRRYEEVCECVGIDPRTYADEIEIVIDDRLVQPGLDGEYYLNGRTIEVRCDLKGLKHELGHWLAWRLGRTSEDGVHTERSLEYRCD